MEKATLGGGCFWCTEAIFARLKGVEAVKPGYSGGDVDNPTYEQVRNGKTGHAEVIQITFDPAIVSFEKILEVFFKAHDPTSLNRQGADQGTQYRSVVFYHNESQKKITEDLIKKLEHEKVFGGKPFVTQLLPFNAFFGAGNYHLNYYERNKNAPYCQMVINPKLDKLLKDFSPILKKR